MIPAFLIFRHERNSTLCNCDATVTRDEIVTPWTVPFFMVAKWLKIQTVVACLMMNSKSSEAYTNPKEETASRTHFEIEGLIVTMRRARDTKVYIVSNIVEVMIDSKYQLL